MRARELLIERRDVYATLARRPLTPDEKAVLEDFQTVLALLKSFYKSPSRDAFGALKDNLRRFHNQSFMRQVHDWIAKVDAHHADIDQGQREAPSVKPQLDAIVTNGLKAAKAGNIAAFIAIGKHAAQVNSVLNRASANPSRHYDRRYKAPLYIQDPLFFGTTNFLRRFEDDDMDDVIALDPSVVTTYMNAPLDDNFQYLAYWATELDTTMQPAALSPEQYRKWVRINYRDDSRFQKLLKLVDDYLYGNQQANITQIAELMKSFPALVRTHEQIIQGIERVYRGVAFPEDGRHSLQDIIRIDRERRVAATSLHKKAASNFALSKGHLESGGGRTDGVVLTYAVTPRDIILDTSVFGSIFGEAEVIISTETAQVVDHDFYYRDDD